MKITIRPILIILFLNLLSCHYYDYKLNIKNNTHFAISIEHSFVLNNYKVNHIEYYLSNKIEIGNQKGIRKHGSNAWERELKNSKNGLLYIYVFNVDSLAKQKRKNLSINDLKTQNRYYKLFALTKQQLDSMNWIVVVN